VFVKSGLQRGFSIIELSVALTIAGVLLALGAPAMSGYLQNARLGTAAQSIYGGLQMARTEAVKRNQQVEFVLTNSALESTSADAVSLDLTAAIGSCVSAHLHPPPTLWSSRRPLARTSAA
jgi:type IV fimbrial biogenesis protein FimT